MIILMSLLIAALIFFPYLRRAVQRLLLLRELKRLCALSKYRLKVEKPLAALFKNFSDTYDFTVDTGKTVYAVKLWDEIYRHSVTVFGADGSVKIMRKVQDTFGENNRKTHRISERELGGFPRLAEPSAEKRQVVRIFSPEPVKIKMLYSDGGTTKELCAKDRLYGMFILPRAALPKLFGQGK